MSLIQILCRENLTANKKNKVQILTESALIFVQIINGAFYILLYLIISCYNLISTFPSFHASLQTL